MKTFLIAFLLGAFTGALTILVLNDQRQSSPPVAAASRASESSDAQPAPLPAEQPRGFVEETRTAINERLAQWHLTPADLKEELAKGGAIIRSKAHVAGEKISDARIVTVIKAKHVLDRDLSARAINVDANDGVVTLSGTAGSPELVGRAIALALESDGVVRVVSNLTVG